MTTQTNWSEATLDENKMELRRSVLELGMNTPMYMPSHVDRMFHHIFNLIANIQKKVESYHTSLLLQFRNQNTALSRAHEENLILNQKLTQQLGSNELTTMYNDLSQRYTTLNNDYLKMLNEVEKAKKFIWTMDKKYHDVDDEKKRLEILLQQSKHTIEMLKNA
jgi:hypothetical protein